MPTKGARLIAEALYNLDVKVLFGLVGVPVIDIAEEALDLGIRFIAFRNEQAASYAATAYGYLTGKPGVCLLVGGPGILHGMAGIGNAQVNAWPLLVLGGSSETHNVNKGAFQELDAISLLTPHTKIAIRPPSPDHIQTFIADAYRTALFGRPGPGFVDLPADYIRGTFDVEAQEVWRPTEIPRAAAPKEKIQYVAHLLKTAKAPLIVLGKGAAYAQAESQIRTLITRTGLPFLPTPMGKGVVPDSDPHNTSSARSTALKESDVILVLGARLNWILHYGEPPKWNEAAKIIQVDISAEELGRNSGDSRLSIFGDIGLAIDELVSQLAGWQWQSQSQLSTFQRNLQASKAKNEAGAARKARVDKIPMTFERVFDVIKTTLHRLSVPENGDIVYISEGSNTMDISRSIFTVEHPRLRLDAGTYATMGVGLGYAIAAHAAFNNSQPEATSGQPGRKKVVAIEGDSSFGFSAMEVETMARYEMDVLIFVINNSGIYHGDSHSADQWLSRQLATAERATANGAGLRSLSLGYEVGYEKIAETCGGIGFLARTPAELERATEEGYKAKVPVIVNVIIEPGDDKIMEFGWLDSYKKPAKKAEAKL